MLLLLAEYLQQFHKGFAVFQYLSLRGILGVLTALSLALWLGPWMIRTLQIRQIGQAVRNDGPQSHLSKSGTPTMGGALILSAIAVSTLLWADLTNRYVWVVLIVTLAFGAIGWVDDYRKVIERTRGACLAAGSISGNRCLAWPQPSSCTRPRRPASKPR